jgi:hypothetical protein
MHRMLRMGWRYRPDVPGVSGTLLTQMIGLRPTMAPRHADRFTKNRSSHRPHDELGRMAIIVWWGQPWWRTNSIWLIESA